MATSSDVSVGLAHELTITATKAGWEPRDFAALAHSEDKAREILAYLRGLSEIKQVTHAIDCDADPFLPNEGWRVEEHRKDGVIVWDPTKASLYLSKGQKGDKYIVGNDLRKELAKKPTMNANVLDYLLKNPHLIPEDWKKDERGNTRYIFFWGTIYRHSGGSLCVRVLCWDGGAWGWLYGWLDDGFDGNNPAALRVS
jgi:hypothetical protein